MFGQRENVYKSDIKLGDVYIDKQTGIQGPATAVFFFQHSCERVCLEKVTSSGELKEYTFDAPRLTHVETDMTARSSRPGGPRGLSVNTGRSAEGGAR